MTPAGRSVDAAIRAPAASGRHAIPPQRRRHDRGRRRARKADLALRKRKTGLGSPRRPSACNSVEAPARPTGEQNVQNCNGCSGCSRVGVCVRRRRRRQGGDHRTPAPGWRQPEELRVRRHRISRRRSTRTPSTALALGAQGKQEEAEKIVKALPMDKQMATATAAMGAMIEVRPARRQLIGARASNRLGAQVGVVPVHARRERPRQRVSAARGSRRHCRPDGNPPARSDAPSARCAPHCVRSRTVLRGDHVPHAAQGQSAKIVRPGAARPRQQFCHRIDLVAASHLAGERRPRLHPENPRERQHVLQLPADRIDVLAMSLRARQRKNRPFLLREKASRGRLN